MPKYLCLQRSLKSANAENHEKPSPARMQELYAQFGAWQEKFNARGGFEEAFIELKFDNKNPLTRRQIGEFCHEIERESARLRVIQLKLRRAGKKDAYDDDAWSGSVTVGYRKAKIRE